MLVQRLPNPLGSQIVVFFKQQSVGRVYVIKLILPDDTVVHKIGMTHSDRAVDRMMEILRSWFNGYRFVPYTELRLNMEFPYTERLEKHIHKVLAHKQFIPNKKVSGGTEMFTDIDEVRVLHYIRNAQIQMFSEVLELSDNDYTHLGQLVSP